jgi:hypothetical protein
MPVYYLPKNGRSVLFSHIPKTGGTTLAKLFAKIGFEEHCKTSMHLKHIYKCPPTYLHYTVLDSLFEIDQFTTSFAIVRNPESRIISDFKWAMTRTDFARDRGYTHRSQLPNINDWINAQLKHVVHDPYLLSNHIRPQHQFVGPKIQHVFKFENGLEDPILKVLSKCNVNISTPKGEILTRSNNTQRVALDTVLTTETKQKIRHFYAEDYERFNYDPAI